MASAINPASNIAPTTEAVELYLVDPLGAGRQAISG
jgi:hypothetical protein